LAGLSDSFKRLFLVAQNLAQEQLCPL